MSGLSRYIPRWCTAGVDKIVDELQNVIVASIRNGEILVENFVQSFVQMVVGICLNLEEIPERFQLYV